MVIRLCALVALLGVSVTGLEKPCHSISHDTGSCLSEKELLQQHRDGFTARAFLATEYEDAFSEEEDEGQRTVSRVEDYSLNGVAGSLSTTHEGVYYGSDWPMQILTPVRLTNTTSEEFEYYARRGIPVIVTDVTRNWPMADWTCDYVSSRFAKDKMRQEYRTGSNVDDNDQSLGDRSWQQVKTPVVTDEAKEGPNYAPFYWDVKDRRSDPTGVKQAVAAATAIPYFFENNPLNTRTMNSTPEFWFSVSKAGAKAHADPHCEHTMSVMLDGVKKWRMGPQVRIDSMAMARRCSDGDVDVHKWRPVFEFTLHKGEGIFFPPGFVHETSNVGDGCASSVTYQWNSPSPTTYVRTFLPRLALSESVGHCAGLQWGNWVTMTPDGAARYQTTHMRTAWKRAKALFARVDTDSNGNISHSELEAFASSWSPQRLSSAVASDKILSPEDIEAVRSALVRDVWDYHDTDGDDSISKQEFMANFRAWSAVDILKKRSKLLLQRYRERKDRSRCQDQHALQAESLAEQTFLSRTPANATSIAELSQACQVMYNAALRLMEATALHLEERAVGKQSTSVEGLGAAGSRRDEL